jgi:DNA-binding NtrC family response regulator
MEKQAQVLVVDDEAVWRNKLAKILEDEGYLVCKATTYKQAMQWLKRRSFHLAVVDVNLADAPVNERGEPGDTRGMDIITKIRRRAIEQDMSVIIVTGYGTIRVAREAFRKLGVFDVIPKQDFDIKEFLSLVADAIALAYYKTPGENL